MRSARPVTIGSHVLLACAVLFGPVALAYTFLAGDRAVAQVTACHRKGRVLSCSGHWRDARGRTGSGHISGVGREDVGHSVEVRIGPLGPYAGGPGGSLPLLLSGLFAVVGVPLAVLAMVLRRFRARHPAGPASAHRTGE